MVTEPVGESVATLTAAVTGAVHVRGDADLQGAFPIQNTLVAHDPELVVRARTEDDVVATLRFASAGSHPVRIVATGHGAHGDVAGGVVLATGDLNRVEVDPATRVARVGAGARWSDVIAAGARHGLLPIAGASGHVGAVGLVHGGGLGPLSASHGAASDRVRAARVALADGSVVDANGDSHPDLFWAIRGGQGPFGVVTSMEIELAPLSRLYGGTLFFDAPHIADALRAWSDWLERKPTDLSTSAAILSLPPLPLIPEPLRGRTVLAVRIGYPGTAEAGAAALEQIRGAAPVHLDLVADMPASAIGSIHNDPEEPGPSWLRSAGVSSLDDDLVSRVLETVGPGTDTPFVATEIRDFGAAWAQDVDGGSAVGGRSTRFSLGHIGVDPSQHDAMTERAAVVETAAASWLAEETNVNFLSGPMTAEKAQRAWSQPVRERLADVRREYDPGGLFGFPL